MPTAICGQPDYENVAPIPRIRVQKAEIGPNPAHRRDKFAVVGERKGPDYSPGPISVRSAGTPRLPERERASTILAVGGKMPLD